jgi:hypothetical protein
LADAVLHGRECTQYVRGGAVALVHGGLHTVGEGFSPVILLWKDGLFVFSGFAGVDILGIGEGILEKSLGIRECPVL